MSDYIFKTTPYAHQIAAHAFLDGRRNAAILGEQGTGKSKILIDDAARCYRDGKINALLIVAPNGVHRNWADKELAEHMPDDIPHRVWCWSSKLTEKQRKKLLVEACEKTDELHILCANVDALTTTKGYDALEKFLGARLALFAVDESTRIKNYKAQRTKAALALARKATARRILSGLPTPRSPVDAYTQFDFLRHGLLGHTSVFSFSARYCVIKRVDKTNYKKTGKRPIPGKDYFDKVVGYRHLDELATLIAQHSFRVMKKDCLDLPPKVYQTLPVELSDDHRALYDRARDNAIAEFSGGMIAAPLMLTRLLRLQQIVGGFAPSTQPDGTIIARDLPCVAPEKNAKLQALLGMLDEFDGKAIIWARFVPELEMIAAALREEYGTDAVLLYHGGTSDDDRASHRTRFQNDDTARFFIASQSAAGIGITLTAASLVVYYSNTFDFEHRAQSEDRAHRIGQTKSVTYVDLVADNTIDARIVKALKDKKDLAAIITRDNVREML